MLTRRFLILVSHFVLPVSRGCCPLWVWLFPPSQV